MSESDLAPLTSSGKDSASHLKLLYIRIGKNDFLLSDARKLDGWLTHQGIAHIYQEVEGVHEWPVWRRALADLAPRLFQTRRSDAAAVQVSPTVPPGR
jgi:enterochelin esterase-like enzyme